MWQKPRSGQSLPVAIQRKDHRKPRMAVENELAPRVENDLAVGGKFAGGGDPRAGGAVERHRVDASLQFVEGAARLADVEELARQRQERFPK